MQLLFTDFLFLQELAWKAHLSPTKGRAAISRPCPWWCLWPAGNIKLTSSTNNTATSGRVPGSREPVGKCPAPGPVHPRTLRDARWSWEQGVGGRGGPALR